MYLASAHELARVGNVNGSNFGTRWSLGARGVDGQRRKWGSLGLRLTGRLWGLGLKGQELLMKGEGALADVGGGSMRKHVFRVLRHHIGGGFF